MNQAEVIWLHDDLACWLGTEAPPEVLERIRAAHRPDFVLVTVNGARQDRDELMEALAGARNAVPGLRIEIEQFEVVAETAGLAVVRFVETHSVGSQRRTTAVLTSGGWLSVHETGIG